MQFKRRWNMVFTLQAVLVCLSLVFAWLLRFDFRLPHLAILIAALPLLLVLRLAAMARFNLFHGYWRFTGVSDLRDIIQAVVLGSVAFAVCERWILRQEAFPISIYVLEALLTVAALSGVRLAAKVLVSGWRPFYRPNCKAVLVVGAGSAAAMLLSELPRNGYVAVGMVDDDPAKRGAKIHGTTVIGSAEDIPALVAEHEVNEIFIAIPSATGKQMRRITEFCQNTRVRFRTIPGLSDFIEERATIEQLRDVNLEDLLGRDPVRLDANQVRTRLQGKVVLVTGGAGSIGSELCRQIARFGPARLICLDQAETPLFYVQQQLGSSAQTPMSFLVADITDSERMRQIMLEYGVQTIFHAAAYKHVPLMEDNLTEALKNNVFGLMSLVETAEQCGCQDFLLISSDKAVNPTSFMGCTKRVGELFLAARRSFRMRCVSVRFGNVLGSQGSVVPLFQEQIRQHRRLTVTHPEMLRYFMTIPEAVSLVLQGFAIGHSGDILVLDMGEPVRILDLARALIRLSGLAENEIKIVFTGLRPGEKLVEELFYETEEQSPTPVSKVLRTNSRPQGIADLQPRLEQLALVMGNSDRDAIRRCMRDIVPEYDWSHVHPPQEMIAKRAAAAARGSGESQRASQGQRSSLSIVQ